MEKDEGCEKGKAIPGEKSGLWSYTSWPQKCRPVSFLYISFRRNTLEKFIRSLINDY